MASLELGAEAMTTSAYNLGNAGLASKILRTKDLTRVAGVEGCPVLGIGAEDSLFADGRMRPSLRGAWVGLGVRSGIVPMSPVEISQ